MRIKFVVVDGQRYEVEQHTSPNLSRRTQLERHGNVLHVTGGSSYRGDIAWQMNPDQRYADGTRVNSASTWIVGRRPGEIAQMGEDQWQPSSQREGNARWNSAENVGVPPQGLTSWQIKVNAYILWWLHEFRGIAIAVADHPGERGLGHHSMDREAWGEEWGHESCPGPNIVASKPEIVRLAKLIKAGETVTDDGYDWPDEQKLTATTERVGSLINERDVTPDTWTPSTPNTPEPNKLGRRIKAMDAKLDELQSDLAQVLARLPAPPDA